MASDVASPSPVRSLDPGRESRLCGACRTEPPSKRVLSKPVSFDEALAARLATPAIYPRDRFEGRGIVICAGGARYFTCAWVLIAVLRQSYRCTLPIQVWHLGRREMSDEMQILLAEEGVEVVDAEAAVARYPARIAGGWPLKPYAIAQSRFREVLYLDADTVPLADPQAAFEWAAYREHGLLMWPDVVDLTASNPVWARLGLESGARVSIDSGIIVADKARMWDVLDLAILFNEHHDELYDKVYGDKDTFLLGALLLKRGFGVVPHRPFQAEWDMVQRDPAGEPFLHHRTGSKWFLESPNRGVVDPSLTPVCDAALESLRRRWSGAVFHAPERSPRARAEEERLISLHLFRYQTQADDLRDLELLSGGRIGPGRGSERNWAVVDGPHGPVIEFYEGHRRFALEQVEAGLWRGSTGAPGSMVLLYEPAGREWADEQTRRVPRPAESVVASLLTPTLFALGYQAERATALETTLSFLNDLFDDVPEQISEQTRDIPPEWKQRLDALIPKLAAARDERLALISPQKMRRPVRMRDLYTRHDDV